MHIAEFHFDVMLIVFLHFFFVFYETKHIKPQYFFNFSDSIKKDG